MATFTTSKEELVGIPGQTDQDLPIRLTPAMLQGASDDELDTLINQGKAQDVVQLAQTELDTRREVETVAEGPSIENPFGPPATPLLTDIQFDTRVNNYDVAANTSVTTETTASVLAMLGLAQPESKSLADHPRDVEMVGEQSKARQHVEQAELASIALLDETKSVDERISAATEITNKPVVAKSLGESAAEAMYPNKDVDQEFIDLVSTAIESAHKSADGDAVQRLIIDEDAEQSQEQFMVKERDWVETFWEEVGKLKLNPKAIGLGTLKLVTPAFATQTISTFETQALLDPKNQKTIKDVVDFMNPIDEAPEAELDWGNAWDTVMEEGELGPEFNATMTKKYGEDWGLRWSSFMLKEVGVDGAILAIGAAIPPVGAVMFAGRKAKLATKAVAVTARAVALGVGGGAVQASMNKISGRDADFGTEVAIRAGASVVGDVGLTALRLGFKASLKATSSFKNALLSSTETLAKKSGLKVLSGRQRLFLLDGTRKKPSLASTVSRAVIHAQTKEYMALSRSLVDGLDAPTAKMQQIRTNLSELTGIPDAELEVRLGLGREIFAEQEFKNIGKAPIFKEAQSEIAVKEAELLTTKTSLQKAQKKLTALDKAAPPKTEKGIANRQALVTELQETIAEQEVRVTAEAEKITTARETLRPLEESLTTGSSLADNVILGKAYGFRLMGSEYSRQQGQREVFQMFYDGQSYQPRPYSAMSTRNPNSFWNPAKYTVAMKNVLRISEPENMPLSGPVRDFFDAVNKTGQLSKVFEKAISRSLRGLSNKEQVAVFQVIETGSREEVSYDVAALRAFGLRSKQVDSYYAVRANLDLAHFANDNAIVNAMKAEVDSAGLFRFMMYQGVPVQVQRSVDNVVLTALDKKAGLVGLKEIPYSANPADTLPKLVPESELKELTSVLPYHEGYIPIVYKNARFHVSIIDPATGTLERVAAEPSMRKAIKSRDVLQRANKGKIVFFGEWNEMHGFGGVSMRDDSMRLLEAMDPQSMTIMKEQLTKAGIDNNLIDKITIGIEHLDGTSLRRAFVGARTERLKTFDPKSGKFRAADRQAAPEAIAEYLQSTAQRAGTTEWRSHAVKSFTNTYARRGIIDSSKKWFEDGFIKQVSDRDPRRVAQYTAMLKNIKAKKVKGIEAKAAKERQIQRLENMIQTDRELIAEAKQYQRWLKRTLTHTTYLEKGFDNFNKRTSEAMLTSPNRGVRALGILFDTAVPSARTINRAARTAGAVPKLMSFAVAQIFVQGSQAAVTVGSRPIHAARGAADAMIALGSRVAELGGARISKEGEQILTALRRSGYIADLDTNDISGIISNRWKPGGSAIHTFGKLAAAPFRGGEAINRILAFTTTRRDFMQKMGKGTLLGLDGKIFRGAIDDDEFLRLVTDKAKETALNMGRAGELELLSGFGSSLFQFKQVLPKIMNVFETKGLSFREKFGAGATLLGLWGGQGIPLMADLMTGVDWVVWKLQEDNKPSNREVATQLARDSRKAIANYLSDIAPEEWGLDQTFFTRLQARGAINALTDGEWDIANRVALGKFVSEVAESSSLEDMVVSYSVYVDMVDALDKTGLSDLVSIYTYLEIMHKMHVNNQSFTEAFNSTVSGFIPEAIRHELNIEGPQMPLGRAALESAEEFGEAFSMLGSIARYVKNADGFEKFGVPTPSKTDMVDGFRQFSPDQRNLFTSKGGRTTNVEVIPGRLKQLLFGVTPGKLIEQFEAETLARRYTEALMEYRKEINDKLASEPVVKHSRIISDFVSEMRNLQATLKNLEIEGLLAEDYITSSLTSFSKSSIKRSKPNPNLPIQ